MSLRLILVALAVGSCARSESPRATLRCASDADCADGDGCVSGACPGSAELSGPPSLTNSTLVITGPTPLAASGATNATITISLHDSNGVAVTGQTVTIASTGSNNTFSPASQTGTTNGSGVALFYLSTTKEETKAITAVAGAIQLAGSVTFTYTTLSSSLTTFTASSPAVVANGVSSSTLTTTVLDKFGNPAANYPVTARAAASLVQG